jgi:hypothetical protein
MEKAKENELLQLALKALRNNLPEHAEIKTIKPVRDPRVPADYLLQVVIQGKEIRYYVEVKTNVTKADKLLAVIRKADLHHPLLLVAKYINPQLADELKQNGTEFVDAAGNTFINQPPLYVFVKGNKPDVIKAPPLKRAFKPAGLKVIYGFLCNPGLENKKYREIVAETDVALGTVDWTMKELKELRFLLDMGKRGLKLLQKEKLLQRWVTAYPEQLRPKLTLGHFRGDREWWRQKKLDPLKAQWGGEIAAERLTRYLQPQIITIYTMPQQLNQLLAENRLRKDETGDVEILKRFWKPPEMWQYEDLVHPILIYADLLATGNERNVETAKMLYDKHILELIRED